MKKFRITLIILAIVIIIAELVFIDFSNLSSSKNFGPYATLTGMILLIISQIIEIRKLRNML
jgi:hypothetical protein